MGPRQLAGLRRPARAASRRFRRPLAASGALSAAGEGKQHLDYRDPRGPKAAVIGVIALVFGEVLSFTAFFLSEAILSSHHTGLSLAHPRVIGAVGAAGVALSSICLLGVALGAIIRHTAGAVAALPALLCLPWWCRRCPHPGTRRSADSRCSWPPTRPWPCTRTRACCRPRSPCWCCWPGRARACW